MPSTLLSSMAFAPFFSHPWQMCQPVVIRAPHIETVPCQETSRPIPFEQMQINADAQAQQEPQRQCPKLGPLSSSQRPDRTFPRLPQPVTHPCIEPDVTLGPDRLFEGSGSSEPSASSSSSSSQCPRSPAVVRVRAPDSGGADALVATEARIDAPHLSTKAMGGCIVLQAGLPTVAKHANASMHSNMEGTAIKSTSQSPRSLTEVEAESRRPEDEGIVLATTWRGNILNAGKPQMPTHWETSDTNLTPHGEQCELPGSKTDARASPLSEGTILRIARLL